MHFPISTVQVLHDRGMMKPHHFTRKNLNKCVIHLLVSSFSASLPLSAIQASAALPPSSSLQSLVPPSSLPPSLWCHGSLAPGGEGRREEGMWGRRDGRLEEGRGCVGCCHLFPCSYHHIADKQFVFVLLSPGKSLRGSSFGRKLLVAEAQAGQG